jgi:translation initiation factor 4G
MSRTGSRRGHDRGDAPQVGPDGWTPVAGGSIRAQPKAGDLSQFGKISKGGGPIAFGPGSIFNKKESKPTRDRDSISRTNSSSNMFSMLSQGSEAPAVEVPHSTGKSSRPPSRKPSIDLGSAAPEPPVQRKKLVLQPRTLPAAGDATTPTESRSVSGDDDEEQAPARSELSDVDAKRKIEEDAKEFFAVRDLDEAENYFTALPAPHHPKLVDKLVGIASESGKQDLAQLTADLFARALSKSLSTHDALEEGLGLVAEIIDDLAIDAPTAPKLFALIVKGANLNEERRTRIASKSMEPDKLIALLSS